MAPVCGPNGQTCAAAHVTKLNPTGTSILWSTFVGGAKPDGSDTLYFTGPIQLDGNGNVYIMGQAGAGFQLVDPVEPTQTAGPCRWSSPNLTPQARSCCFPQDRIQRAPHCGTRRAGSRLHRRHLSRRQYHRRGPDHDSRRIPDHLQRQPGVLLPRLCRQDLAGLRGPQISVGNVINAATFQTGGIAPNEFIAIKGSGLGPATGVASSMTTLLAGTSVYISGTAGISDLCPGWAGKRAGALRRVGSQGATIQVGFNGVKGNSVTSLWLAPHRESSPRIMGRARHGSSTRIRRLIPASNPAARNTYIEFWLTGQGARQRHTAGRHSTHRPAISNSCASGKCHSRGNSGSGRECGF